MHTVLYETWRGTQVNDRWQHQLKVSKQMPSSVCFTFLFSQPVTITPLPQLLSSELSKPGLTWGHSWPQLAFRPPGPLQTCKALCGASEG